MSVIFSLPLEVTDVPPVIRISCLVSILVVCSCELEENFLWLGVGIRLAKLAGYDKLTGMLLTFPKVFSDALGYRIKGDLVTPLYLRPGIKGLNSAGLNPKP